MAVQNDPEATNDKVAEDYPAHVSTEQVITDVEHPANDPTLNDVEQSFEDRADEARATALRHHDAEHTTSSDETAEEEEA